MPSVATLSTLEKALAINLDPNRYGTFAEIGAGQEVVRWFFQAGGAAGTISKSISAYDMQVSDAIYGECRRYVCRERLEAMLEYEQGLNRERLAESRGSESCLFAFADTVSARNYHGTNECHAWMGIRFQASPLADDSCIVIHARMLDDDNASQQEALGIVGVNLVHGAYNLHGDPDQLVATLVDGLSPQRIEIDMIDVSGPAFINVDNRILSLRLVQLGLTGAAMFAADGRVLQPSEALRKRALVVERGRFRPVTHVNIDMLDATQAGFATHADDPLTIMEISMHVLADNGEVCLADFVSRAEVLATTGHTVMISDFPEYYRLAAYLSRYTDKPIAMAMGLNTLQRLFDENSYEHLQGGVLESLGRLFKNQIKLFIYPQKDRRTGAIQGLRELTLADDLRHLLEYLLARNFVVPLEGVSPKYLDIHSPVVLDMIGSGSGEWKKLVPECVANAIVERKLFGYTG